MIDTHASGVAVTPAFDPFSSAPPLLRQEEDDARSVDEKMEPMLPVPPADERSLVEDALTGTVPMGFSEGQRLSARIDFVDAFGDIASALEGRCSMA